MSGQVRAASSSSADVESWTAIKMLVDDGRMCARRPRLSLDEIRLLDASGFTAEGSDERGGTPRAQDVQRAAQDEPGMPGLNRLLESLPTDWHPDSIAGLLHTPHPDIAVDGRPATPLEWLEYSGGDIAPILKLVEIAEWAAR